MPRAHNPGPSTLRNRNRVTNKTRLHIVHGSFDADPLAFDEDEEKARIVSTAGVDAEDANVSPYFLLKPVLGPLLLGGAWWHALIGCLRESFVPRNADSSPFYRNITCRLSYPLPHNATPRAPPVVLAISPSSNRMRTSQSRTMLALWKTMSHFTHPTGGETRSPMSRLLRRPRKPRKMPLPMVSRISWMSATKNGSTRTTKKLVVKGHPLKALYQRPAQQRGPRSAAQRRRARSLTLCNPSSFLRTNSNL